jgi:Fic family protein
MSDRLFSYCSQYRAWEKQFLVSGGVFVGTARHLGKEERDQLTIEAMSVEAVTTSEIEGEILDRASVESSIPKQLGLARFSRRARSAHTRTENTRCTSSNLSRPCRSA